MLVGATYINSPDAKTIINVTENSEREFESGTILVLTSVNVFH